MGGLLRIICLVVWIAFSAKAFASANVTGQWDFDHGDLRATVGTDLEYFGDTASQTTFPVVLIAQEGARVMSFGSNSIQQGFLMRHGANPNGGGYFVNQYTLIMDVMFPTSSTGHWRALFQTDPFNHDGNDAEFYVSDNSTKLEPNALGTEKHFNGQLFPDTWYRIAFVVDLTAPDGQQLTKYVNGVRVGTQFISGGIDGRYALGPTALLFTAGISSPGFTQPGYVNSIQFLDGCLDEESIGILGSAKARGIPPGNAAIQISDVRRDGSSVTLNWTGRNGPFRVQQAADINIPLWQYAGGLFTNFNATIPFNGSSAVYRVSEFQPDIRVGQLPGDAQVLPTKQIVQSAGQRIRLSGRPVDLALSPDGKTIYVKNMLNVVVVDVASLNIMQLLNYPQNNGASMHGIAVSKDGLHVYVTDAINSLHEAGVGTNGMLSWSRSISMIGADTDPCGVALSSDGSKAYVCVGKSNIVAVVDLASGTVTKQINVGIAPWDIVLSQDNSVAYVSDWGGRRPLPGDTTALSAGSQVVVDQRGIGSSGTVSIVNLISNSVVAEIPTGLHPSDIELSSDGSTLYVANANSDTVTVIDTIHKIVKEIIQVRPDSQLPFGSASDAVALSKDGKDIFVASGGNNAIAVVELPNAQHTNSLVQGFIPTDWYPGSVLATSNILFVASAKGLGSVPPVVNTQIGSMNIIPVPNKESLSKYTARVQENGRVPQILKAYATATAPKAPVPVPEKLGSPSVFKHVLYIIKENKTYDQILGDMSQGNGWPDFCLYPQNVSPNHHALAAQYVLLDNYYCNGVNSADGHSWSTEGYVTDHLERSFGGFTRGYPYGDDALTYSSSGFIWNNVLAHGLSFRNYGELYVSGPGGNTWLQIYAAYTNGTQLQFANYVNIDSLKPYCSTNYPGFTLTIPDVVRADKFIRELKVAQSNGFWPTFNIMGLGGDHTVANTPGYPIPTASVADNDLALGRIVEAVTKSSFGSNTVIFVIEDDPLSGWDHVDGHRSVCLVISPYTKRGQTISTFYNQTGVLHTMEQIMGIPPMNQMDAMGPLMFDCFTNVPDFTGYTALSNNIPLDTMNPGTTAAKMTAEERYWAKKSMKLDFSKPDAADDNTLNRILWHSVKGNVRYPREFAGAHGKGLKKLGLVITKTSKDDDDD
ncbi:alkaline phosphatase family protein [Pedosphaera parvula]|uniref:40-residue YVTN family beta-propeller repeat protein n=1 Tax=Pedosphaera parvula (strain Ellin514) TaxID=320771 RepID=B9XDL6_PEDPL|nr:alkaline phosphatase family protein [Pedosphaera parvula]EEF62162.1 40-residue YVTN family beta-propeller repeat protein [Pedosphaera parvula Ellin514]